MSKTISTLRPPPLRDSGIPAAMQYWFFDVQRLEQLALIDTSAGSFAENVPAAGLNTATGSSNQNQEIVYKKTSADGNTFTLNGVADGAQTLTAQYSKVRIKSDGTNWYVV